MAAASDWRSLISSSASDLALNSAIRASAPPARMGCRASTTRPSSQIRDSPASSASPATTLRAVGPADGASKAWAALPGPWQAAFRGAWVSWQAGSLAVGAAVAGPYGSLVTGRNALLEHDRSVTPLAGTLMAHAEMAALARLPTGDYRGHELYTTFEPCVMCASTIRIYRIGRVHYASPDPIWEGLQEAFAELPSMARRLPERHLLGGALGVFGHALHLAAVWGRVDEHEWVIEQHAQCAPREVGVARRLLEDGRLDRWGAEGRSVEEVVAALWSELSETAATP